MPTLKEIKTRINSVQSTLKITSAMKLVASAKLRKAQQAIEGMRPYERKMQEILSRLLAQTGGKVSGAYASKTVGTEEEPLSSPAPRRIAVVAFASNSALCGSFNANAVREVMTLLQEDPGADVTVYSIGRKMAEAMRKIGKPSPADYQHLAESPSYEAATELAESLMADFREGRLDRVELVYNHFVSSSRQAPVRETFLPMEISPRASLGRNDTSAIDYILEPSAEALLEEMLPKALKLKFYAALLDSNASEHAARTIAMQTATDNGEDLLQELTLQYNKSRQYKITSEILDLAGGNQEQS